MKDGNTRERRLLQVVAGLSEIESDAGSPDAAQGDSGSKSKEADEEREPSGRITVLQERLGVVELPWQAIAIVVDPSRGPQVLEEGLKHILSLEPKRAFDIVVVGGGDEVRPVLEGLVPGAWSRRRVRCYQWRDDGELWTAPKTSLDSPAGERLVELRRRDEDPPSRERLEALLPPEPSPAEREAMVEQHDFVVRYRRRRPLATWALLGLILGIFGLEHLWGGAEHIPLLFRMGANAPASFPADPWRLLSHAVLHANLLHIAANTLVLGILGSFVERIFGTARMLVLFVLGALAGGLVSASGSDAAVSVGASGAIWAFLGACAALAFKPQGLFPRAAVPRLRRIIWINLAINVGASFMPQVDWMAHLGGGLVGFAFGWSSWCRPAPVSGDARDVSDQTPPRSEAWWRIGASLGVVTLLACVAWAWVDGRPWALRTDPVFETRVLEPVGLQIEVPRGLDGPRVEVDGAVRRFDFGLPLGDPALMSVVWVPYDGPALGPDELRAEARAYEAQLEVPEGAVEVHPPKRLPDANLPTFELAHRWPNGLLVRQRHVLMPRALVFIQVELWPGAPESWSGAASRMLEAVEPHKHSR